MVFGLVVSAIVPHGLLELVSQFHELLPTQGIRHWTQLVMNNILVRLVLRLP